MVAQQQIAPITAETRVSTILKMDEKAIDVLTGISKHFQRLRNPLLRKGPAPVVIVSQAIGIRKVRTQ